MTEEDVTINPVFMLMIRGDKGPSDRALRWGGTATVLAGWTISLLPILLITQYPVNVLPAVMVFGLAVVVSLFSPAAGLVLSSGLTARSLAGDHLALIRLTGLSADQIEAGCVDGIVERLRVLRAAGLWILPAAVVGCSYVLSLRLFWSDVVYGPSFSIDRILAGTVPALIVIVVAMWIYRLIWQWCIRIGVWIGLWQSGQAWTAGGAAAIVYAAIYGLAIVLQERLASSLYQVPVALITLFACTAPVIIIGRVSQFARSESIWILEQQISESNAG